MTSSQKCYGSNELAQQNSINENVSEDVEISDELLQDGFQKPKIL